MLTFVHRAPGTAVPLAACAAAGGADSVLTSVHRAPGVVTAAAGGADPVLTSVHRAPFTTRRRHVHRLPAGPQAATVDGASHCAAVDGRAGQMGRPDCHGGARNSQQDPPVPRGARRCAGRANAPERLTAVNHNQAVRHQAQGPEVKPCPARSSGLPQHTGTPGARGRPEWTSSAVDPPRGRHAATEAAAPAGRGDPILTGDTAVTRATMPPKKIYEALRVALRRCRRRRRQIYLELFSGTGRLAHALQKKSGCPVLCLDVRHNAAFDLTQPTTQRCVLGWITSGMIKGVWCGHPCSTWSRARWPPLRSNEYLFGIPEVLRDRRLGTLVKQGNQTLKFAARVGECCQRIGVPVIFENPATAMSWATPQMQCLARYKTSTTVVTDYCCYGTPWRKRTKLLGVRVSNLERLGKTCSGAGGFCHTGKQHVRLRGTEPRSRQLYTRLAEPYPRRFAEAAADVLHNASEHQMLNSLFNLASARPGASSG